MKKIFYILSILITTVLLGIGVSVSYTYLLKKEKSTIVGDEFIKYEIVISEQINIYYGEENRLLPYLISDAGTVEKARFDYETSTPDVSVSYEGDVTVHSVPQEPVFVTISERNTGATKTICLNVIQDLEKVLGMIAPDGNLIRGDQSLYMGQTYALTVVTEPRHTSIEGFCKLKTVDRDGVEHHVFSMAYDGDKVLLTVVGLGEGMLDFSVEKDEQELFTMVFGFKIDTFNETLGDQILANENKPLLSDTDLAAIERLRIDDSVTNLWELTLLPALKTVVIEEDYVVEYEEIPAQYHYRVKESLYEQYRANEKWAEAESSLVPYVNDATEQYVIYHSEKAKAHYYEAVNDTFILSTYVETGYVNTGWIDSDNRAWTTETIKQDASFDVLHLYAVWRPIEYKIHYHVRNAQPSMEFFADWSYETVSLLKDLQDEDCGSVGYRFAGWTETQGSDMYSTFVQYKKDEAVEKLTTEDNGVVHLYDLWEPIEYTIVFDMESADGTHDGAIAVDKKDQQVSSLSLQYTEEAVLPTAKLRGYTFARWETESGLSFAAFEIVSGVTATDGEVVVCKPVFTENSYTLRFDAKGGECTAGLDMNTYTKTLLYTESYRLPNLEKSGYPSYVWYCDVDGDNVKDADEMAFGPTEQVSKLISEGEVYMRAIWTSAQYKVYLDYTGGTTSGGKTSIEIQCAYDEEAVYFPKPTKVGHKLIGWERQDTKEVYLPEAPLYNLTDDNGAMITFKAQWERLSYDLKIKTGVGTNLTVKIDGIPYGDGTHKVLYGATIVSSCSAQAHYNSAKVIGAIETMPAKACEITSSAKINTHTVTINIGKGSKITVKIAGEEKTFSATKDKDNEETWLNVPYGASISVIKCEALTDFKDPGYTCEYSTMPDKDIIITSWATATCFASGTMIAMADGTEKKIEDISVGDMVMSWNFETGKMEAVPVTVFWDHGTTTYTVTNLAFSNGETLRVINKHGLFDYDLKEYVFITDENCLDYVGHHFVAYSETGYELIVLEEAYLTRERTGSYSLLTACNDNAYAEGVLTITPKDSLGLPLFFAVEEDMTYDDEAMQADIEKYGLYTYEEWSEYLTYEQFVAFNGKYYKIFVGKGLLTEEDLQRMILGLKL